MLIKRFLIRRFSIPLVVSVALHGTLVAALLYASVTQIVELPRQEQASLSVTMVTMMRQTEHSIPQEVMEEVTPQVEEVVPEPIPPMPVTSSDPEKAKPEKKKPKKQPKKKKETEKNQKPQFNPVEKSEPALSETETGANLSNQEPVKTISSAANNSVLSAPKVLSLSKPGYPPRALALGIEGKVKVQFDVDGDGRVTNVRILSAEPRNMFEREVKQAMRKWRYEAKMAKDLTKTILFRIDGSTELN